MWRQCSGWDLSFGVHWYVLWTPGCAMGSHKHMTGHEVWYNSANTTIYHDRVNVPTGLRWQRYNGKLRQAAQTGVIESICPQGCEDHGTVEYLYKLQGLRWGHMWSVRVNRTYRLSGWKGLTANPNYIRMHTLILLIISNFTYHHHSRTIYIISNFTNHHHSRTSHCHILNITPTSILPLPHHKTEMIY